MFTSILLFASLIRIGFTMKSSKHFGITESGPQAPFVLCASNRNPVNAIVNGICHTHFGIALDNFYLQFFPQFFRVKIISLVDGLSIYKSESLSLKQEKKNRTEKCINPVIMLQNILSIATLWQCDWSEWERKRGEKQAPIDRTKEKKKEKEIEMKWFH